MIRFIVFLFLFFWVELSWTQYHLEMDPFQSSFFAQKIDTNNIKQHISYLASDELAGRETGTPGLQLAAQYIVQHLKESGVKSFNNDYFQPISLAKTNWKDIGLSVNGEAETHLQTFLALPHWNKNVPFLDLDQIVFVGYGIDDHAYSDYQRVNVKGKTILILAGEPFDEDGISYVTNTTTKSEWSDGWEKKLMTAKNAGARMVLMIDPNIVQTIAKHRNTILNARVEINSGTQIDFPNNMFISPDVAKRIIGDKSNVYAKNIKRIRNTGLGRPIRLSVDVEIRQHLLRMANYSSNIIGLIEGNHPVLKDEFIFLTAHYDHLGQRGQSIFPGADDNGSGTATVLEIMDKLSSAQSEGVEFKRSIACIFFAGEEKGLLGSKYYVQNPVVPLLKTVANVNVDMIGRTDSKHARNPNYIYVIGANRISQELHDINEAVNRTFTNLVLDYTYNEEDDPNRFYYRSDHYNFAKNGIPSIFYFSGVHEDYHQPGDTPEKIMFSKLLPITQLIFHCTWELAVKLERLSIP